MGVPTKEIKNKRLILAGRRQVGTPVLARSDVIMERERNKKQADGLDSSPTLGRAFCRVEGGNVSQRQLPRCQSPLSQPRDVINAPSKSALTISQKGGRRRPPNCFSPIGGAFLVRLPDELLH